MPWINTLKLSDGNGIIIDANNHPYGATTGTPYSGRTLVENNISFNNGGSGMHAFSANHVDIVNNTAYNNGVVMGYADMYASYSSDVKMINNISYSKTGGKANVNSFNGADVIYDYNIYFNGTTTLMGPHDKIADPLFILPSTDPAVANFSLRSNSPAIDGGTSTIFAAKDFLGNTRPKGANPDCGAYEVN